MADQDKFVVVTGAAGGIGRALVAGFREAGYSVIASDLGAAPLDLHCSLWIDADLRRCAHEPGYASAIFDRILAHASQGTLRALVNNAAIQVLGGIDSLAPDDWHHSLDVNLVAPFVWTQALLPALERAGGCVVNISSIHARLTKRNFVAYATSKAALSGMTRALAVDMGHRVRINAIEPAAIATPMLAAGFEGKPDLLTCLEQAHPVNRIGHPDDVAALAVALCDNRTPFMNGACIAVDGGIGARLHDPD